MAYGGTAAEVIDFAAGHQQRIAERGGGVDGDVVDSHSGPPNHFQFTGLLKHVRGDTCRAAANDSVVFGDPLEEIFFRQRRHLVHGDPGLRDQECDTYRIDLVGHQNFVVHWFSVQPFQAASSAPITSWLALRTRGRRNSSGSSESFSSQRSSESCA